MRQKVIGRTMGALFWPISMLMLILLPMGGMGQLNVLAMTSVAFWPVVIRVLQWGIFWSSVGISVGVTTSRKASEALSFRRRTSHAVS